jgi:hypothetical protein
MPGESLTRIGDFLQSSWKILSVVGAMVYAIYLGSVEHFTNREHRLDFEKYKEERAKEDKVRDERSDKRYERAIQMYTELSEHGQKLEAELEKHLIEDAYNRGKTDATLEYLKKK